VSSGCGKAKEVAAYDRVVDGRRHGTVPPTGQ